MDNGTILFGCGAVLLAGLLSLIVWIMVAFSNVQTDYDEIISRQRGRRERAIERARSEADYPWAYGEKKK